MLDPKYPRPAQLPIASSTDFDLKSFADTCKYLCMIAKIIESDLKQQ